VCVLLVYMYVCCVYVRNGLLVKGITIDFILTPLFRPAVLVTPSLVSLGSDSVYLCTSPEEVQVAFARINGQFNGLGMVNDGALCQEFLEGTEYVIDGVSRDGVYKVCWWWHRQVLL
jgi:hypothetical protein